MLTYTDCSIEEFNATMAKKNNPVTELNDRELCILFTKYRADLSSISNISGYSRFIEYKTKEKMQKYAEELKKRKFLIRM